MAISSCVLFTFSVAVQWEVDFSSHFEDTAHVSRDDLIIGTGGNVT